MSTQLQTTSHETEHSNNHSGTRWFLYTKRLLHYFESKFKAIVFEIISRSQLLNITIQYLNKHFSTFTQAVENVRTSFHTRMQQFIEAFNTAGKYIGEVDNSFNDIDEAFKKSYSLGQDLQREAEEAGKQLSTLEDLAEKTNMLALNASIQAARAGSHGAAFAVVAREIRRHGEQSKSIVSNTTEHLKGMIDLIFQLVEVMHNIDQSVEKSRGNIRDLLENTEEGRAMADAVQKDVNSILEAFQEYDVLRDSLNRMISQSSVSNAEIEEMLLSFQADIDKAGSLRRDAVD
jgi:methyl-accepting chemotaxis protein